MKSDLYLLDGYSIIYRSYFAFIRNPLRDLEGNNTSAIFGFFRTLFSILNERNPENFAVVMDSQTPTFRHDKYPDYKITREKTPDDLKSQIPEIEEILEALSIPMIRVNGYEADDVMASFAEICSKEGRTCYIISGDKDLLQMIDGAVRILRPDKGNFIEMDRDEVYETWGVYPEQILDYLALIGDTSDNVPGVKGIGAKTAVKLLSEYGDLDGIYSHLEEISSASVKKRLEEGKESAYLSKDLILLEKHVPTDVKPDDFTLESITIDKAVPLFLEKNMRSIAEELQETSKKNSLWQTSGKGGNGPGSASVNAADRSPSGAASAGVPSTAGPETAPGAQTANLTGRTRADRSLSGDRAVEAHYETLMDLDALDAWIDRVRKDGVFAFDSETDSLDSLMAKPVGFSLSSKAGYACYVPLQAGEGEILPADQVRLRFKTLLEDPSLRVIGQNLKYDYKVLRRWGIQIKNIYFDTMIAAWLLDAAGGNFGMDDLALRYLQYRTLHYKDIVAKNQTFDQIELFKAAHYAAEDADITYRLYEHFLPELRERKLDSLFFDIEIPLLPVLAEMELKGIGLDSKVLAAYSRELAEKLADIEREVFRLCGEEFNIASTKQLQEVLFVKRKLTPVKKTKTGYSTDTSVLQVLAREDPVPELVLKHRLTSKLKSTYVDALPRLINAKTGRLHTHFNMTGTATGRLSSTDPNLQNIPIRDEEGRMIRKAFVSAPGYSYISADYSQIELVVLAHLSGDKELSKAFQERMDVHAQTASLIFGVGIEEVTAEMRRIAKTINFGVMYGMSAFRLSRDLEIPRDQADAFISAYFKRYSGVKAFIDKTIAEAEDTGLVSTIMGRQRALPTIRSRNKTEKMAAERIAINTPIQGSAADIVKVAMLKLSRKLSEEDRKAFLLLQVHDELILEVLDEEVESVSSLVRDVMENAVSLDVPLRVSIETGNAWGDMH